MRHTIGVLLATMVLSTSAALPQTSDDGEITGRIVDAQGVAIPGVLPPAGCSGRRPAPRLSRGRCAIDPGWSGIDTHISNV